MRCRAKYAPRRHDDEGALQCVHRTHRQVDFDQPVRRCSKKVADNVKVNPQTLLDTVKRSMQTSKLLDENSGLAVRTVDIVITDMRTRSNFTAIAFGFMAGADMVKGDVITRDLQGKVIDRFAVHADYALGGLAGGMDSTRMDWLYCYEKFAQLTLENLQGASDNSTGTSEAKKVSTGK